MPPKKAVPTKPAAKGATAAKPAPKAASTKKPVAVKTTGTAKPGAKKGAAPAGKGKAASSGAKAAATPAAKKWTKEDEAARIIQTQARRYLARKEKDRRKKEKEDYEALMERLEKEAFAKLVKMEQEQAEKERQKDEEERKRKREMIKRRKRMLEAAFDGDNDEINTVLKEIKDLDDKAGVGHDVIGRAIRAKNMLAMVECEDANENTPLSEASSGGVVDTVRLLIEKGADPNTKGQFGRSPLYRAAFAGHLEVVQALLQFGADPRVYADDGQSPEHIASLPAITELLTEWDVTQTDSLLVKMEGEKERRKEEARQRREAETSILEEKLEEEKKDYENWQKQLVKCSCELNKRIYEHDSAAVEHGKVKPEVTLQAIHDAESEMEIAKLHLETARNKLGSTRLQLRNQQAENAEASGEEMPGLKVVVRELDDVLLRDVGNPIANSGKWPLLIDPSGQAATFLRYRDTNYLQALSPKEMEPDKIRKSLLGSLRYGKPVVLDMMEVDMFETVTTRFNEIMPGCMEAIMDKSIMKEEVYLKLLRPDDGPEYDKNNFNSLRTSRFQFFIITKNPMPPESLLEMTYVLRVFLPSS